jgi:hypothetical protein
MVGSAWSPRGRQCLIILLAFNPARGIVAAIVVLEVASLLLVEAGLL